MKALDFYEGRPQTFLKHFLFEKYLEIVAIKVGMHSGRFVFVDAFAGPWRSQGGDFDDTSFRIAIDVLTKVQSLVRTKNFSDFSIRCLFIEKDPDSYVCLEQIVSNQDTLVSKTINGSFEDYISEVKSFIHKDFAFLFVDPTGWQGFGLAQMRPLLTGYGEVLINFMFNHINRFIEIEEHSLSLQMDELMGGPDWRPEFKKMIESGLEREEAILETYKHRLKKIGGYRFVTSVRILWPHLERTYFHLIYATDNLKGIEEFSRIEKKFMEEQLSVRSIEMDRNEEARSKQRSLFAFGEQARPQSWFEADRTQALKRAKSVFKAALEVNRAVKFGVLYGQCLELPMVWPSDVVNLVQEMRRDGTIEIPEMSARKKRPEQNHIVRLLK